jgi:hypothetical protein
MTDADLKNESATKYRWSLTSGTDGKPVMVIAPGGTGQGSQFSKEK